MLNLETFISRKFRPDIRGGTLDKNHKTRFYLSKKPDPNIKKVKIINAICFGPKKDNVLINLEHALSAKDNILIFFYEDIHARWSYVSNNTENYFVYKKNKHEQYIIKPKNLYIRSCYVETQDKYWLILGNFFNFVDMWDGKVLCAPNKQVTNESKLYQLNNSLGKSSSKFATISIGRSYVIKGRNKYKQLKQDKSYIVKSLSGIRSIVVDHSNYSQWDINNIDNLPALFQEKIIGDDLRVHIINNKTYGKLACAKENIDYRYDKSFFNLINVDNLPKNVRNFCIAVSKEEDNKLLGIDFIKTKAGYIVLEANPSPGWSAYHNCNGIYIEPFIVELLAVLKK